MFVFVSSKCKYCKLLLKQHEDKFDNMTVINIDPVLLGQLSDDRILDWGITCVPTLVKASPTGNGIVKNMGLQEVLDNIGLSPQIKGAPQLTQQPKSQISQIIPL